VALRHLRDLIEILKASGAILTSIEIPAWKSDSYLGAGIYRDEPLFDRWRADIEAYRQEVEADPDRP
jgi:hypothetical protein